MSTKMNAGIAGLFLLCMLSPEIKAQENSATWFQSGFGTSTEKGYSLTGGIYHTSKKALLGLRGTYLESDVFDDNTLLEGSILGGVLKQSEAINLAFLTGLGIVYTEECTSSCGLFGGSPVIEKNTVVGLPLEAQVTYSLSGFARIGVQGSANINTEKSFLGAHFILQLGSFRKD